MLEPPTPVAPHQAAPHGRLGCPPPVPGDPALMYGPSVDSQFPFVLCVLSVLFLDSLKF